MKWKLSMGNRSKLTNNGFSLVEIIVVVAITVVLASFVFMGISVLNSRPVDECAQKLRVALENNRTTTMGKLSASINIYEKDDYIMVEEIINGDSKVAQIGEKSVEVEYYVEGNTRTMPTFPDKLTISFDRSSGALKAQVGGIDDDKYVEKFVVSRGEKEMEISIERLTGRVSIN